jgi:glutathione S-transferase
MTESNDILYYLEEAFPESSLVPRNAAAHRWDPAAPIPHGNPWRGTIVCLRGPIGEGSEVARQLEWAERVADGLDPLVEAP